MKRDIALHPYSPKRYKKLVFAYIKLQEYQQALDTMKRELELVPQDSDTRAFFKRLQASFSASPK